MFKYIEKLFPEFIEKIKSLSLFKRILILILIISLSIFLPISYKNRILLWSILNKPFYITLLQIAVVVFIFLLIFVCYRMISNKLSQKRLIINFMKFWKEFDAFYFIFWNEIDMANTSFENFQKFIFKNSDSFKKFNKSSNEIKRYLFKIGEENLIVQDVYNWTELKEQHDIFKNRNYLTPFSFLADLGKTLNDVGFDRKALWIALQISYEFIENLTFKYPYLKKVI